MRQVRSGTPHVETGLILGSSGASFVDALFSPQGRLLALSCHYCRGTAGSRFFTFSFLRFLPHPFVALQVFVSLNLNGIPFISYQINT